MFDVNSFIDPTNGSQKSQLSIKEISKRAIFKIRNLNHPSI